MSNPNLAITEWFCDVCHNRLWNGHLSKKLYCRECGEYREKGVSGLFRIKCFRCKQYYYSRKKMANGKLCRECKREKGDNI